MMPPKISVCLPVRNGGSFFPLAIDSVLQQSMEHIELIIVDNCSTDGTAALIEENIAKLPNIRFYRNAINIGLAKNFNACLAHAMGQYVKFICADDLLLPQSLRRMADALDADPSVALVVGGRKLIDNNGARVATRRYARKNVKLPGASVINRCIFGKNYIGEPSAVMFRRMAARRGFRESLSHLLDLEMWLYLLEQGDMFCVADEVCAIRQHSGQMSHQNIQSGALVDDNVSLLDEYGRKPYVHNTWSNMAIRKVRMAYRVWMCRDSMDADKRNRILTAYSSKVFY